MTLLLTKQDDRVTRNQLIDIPTPQGTKTWSPVPHHEVATLVAEEANKNGYEIISEEYGLNPSGERMFGVMRFHPEGHPEYTRCLGVRNSHDKSFAVGLTVGVSVLVCSNLCFGGDITIKRKHTSGIDMPLLIPEAFMNMTSQYRQLEARIEQMKQQRLSLNKARLQIIGAAEAGAIPSCDILPVFNEYQNPQHEEFNAPNIWNLYNAFTEIAKKYKVTRADKCYRTLASLFGMNTMAANPTRNLL